LPLYIFFRTIASLALLIAIYFAFFGKKDDAVQKAIKGLSYSKLDTTSFELEPSTARNLPYNTIVSGKTQRAQFQGVFFHKIYFENVKWQSNHANWFLFPNERLETYGFKLEGRTIFSISHVSAT
jgi:hypothetical protein